MVNNYDQTRKERLRKEARERYQIHLKKKKIKGEKRLEKDIKNLLKKKKKICISIVRNVTRSYLTIKEVII